MNELMAQQQRLRDAVIAAEPTEASELLGATAPRLAVYREAYAARLVAALRDNHPVLGRVLGDDGFDALARAYVAAHPSRQPSIRWFGHRLAEFMAGAEDIVPHPAMVDIARMEWALRTAFDAADGPILGFDALAAVPPEDWPALRFHPHPSAQCVAMAWSVEPAWRALQSAGDDQAEPELPEPEALAHHLLVWRLGLETRWRSIDEGETELWRALAAGSDFAALCALAARRQGEAAAAGVVAGALRQWVDDGVLGAMSRASSTD